MKPTWVVKTFTWRVSYSWELCESIDTAKDMCEELTNFAAATGVEINDLLIIFQGAWLMQTVTSVVSDLYVCGKREITQTTVIGGKEFLLSIELVPLDQIDLWAEMWANQIQLKLKGNVL